MSGLPIRIAIRVDFSDGSQHDYEVRSQDATAEPSGTYFWPEGVVTLDMAARMKYDLAQRERIAEAERQLAEVTTERGMLLAGQWPSPWIPADPDGLPPETYPFWRRQEMAKREAKLAAPETRTAGDAQDKV